MYYNEHPGEARISRDYIRDDKEKKTATRDVCRASERASERTPGKTKEISTRLSRARVLFSFSRFFLARWPKARCVARQGTRKTHERKHKRKTASQTQRVLIAISNLATYLVRERNAHVNDAHVLKSRGRTCAREFPGSFRKQWYTVISMLCSLVPFADRWHL